MSRDARETRVDSQREILRTAARLFHQRAAAPKDDMFAVTDIKQAPWYVVNAENKKCARLNLIHHLLSLIPYRDMTPERLKLPPLDKTKYVRPPIQEQTFVPELYSSGE